MKSTKEKKEEHKQNEKEDPVIENEKTALEKEEDRIKTDFEALKTQNQDLINTLKRLQAEFENYKKRVENQRQENIQNAARDTILQILPVLDNFEAAIEHAKKENENSETFKGFEMIYQNLKIVLENSGVCEMDCVGKEFNPYEHEALFQEESKQKENTVLGVLQKGYKLHDKVLRHAKVKISK